MKIDQRHRLLITALLNCVGELERLHRAHSDTFSGKIGEPDMAMCDRAYEAIEFARTGRLASENENPQSPPAKLAD